MKPKFIVIEGGEGSGKSTLTKALKEQLGERALFTREPGGSEYGEAIRDIIFNHPLSSQSTGETVLCLMFAARFDHLHKSIVPALKNGQFVVSDRFDSSSYAYNVHTQSGGALESVFWSLRDHFPTVPDLYVFLDVDPVEGIRRTQSRKAASNEGNYFDEQKLDFHRKVREGYIKFLERVPHLVIDANRPLEAVKKDFLDKLREVVG